MMMAFHLITLLYLLREQESCPSVLNSSSKCISVANT